MFFQALGFHERRGGPPQFLALLLGDEWAEKYFIDQNIPYRKGGVDPAAPFGPDHIPPEIGRIRLAILDFPDPRPSEKELFREKAGKILWMDDEGRSDPENEICDFVVNGQYLGGEGDGRTRDAGRYLVGPSYFFLTDELLEWKKKPKVYPNRIQTVFVGFGGAIHDQFQQPLVNLLADCGIRRVSLTTGFHPSPDTGWISRSPLPVDFCSHPNSVAKGMAEADFSITSGGLMKFESAAVGTPPIILALNEGQERVSRPFEECGLGRYLGRISESQKLPEKQLSDLVRQWTADPSPLREMGERGRKIISGDGVRRMIALVRSLLEKGDG
jgi:spore coat polysaccharide biosynthesis predicted glycosyltransferase SpsG